MAVSQRADSIPSQARVIEAIELYKAIYNQYDDDHETIKKLGLNSLFKSKVRLLSAGQKQLLSLYLALISKPQLLILDEPTSELDPSIRRHVWEVILKRKKDGAGALIATHNMDEARFLCDKIAFLVKGSILEFDSLPNIMKKYSSDKELIITSQSEIRSLFPEFKKIDNHTYSLRTNKPWIDLQTFVSLSKEYAIDV